MQYSQGYPPNLLLIFFDQKQFLFCGKTPFVALFGTPLTDKICKVVFDVAPKKQVIHLAYIIQPKQKSEGKIFHLQAHVDPNMQVSWVTIAVKYYPAEDK